MVYGQVAPRLIDIAVSRQLLDGSAVHPILGPLAYEPSMHYLRRWPPRLSVATYSSGSIFTPSLFNARTSALAAPALLSLIARKNLFIVVSTEDWNTPRSAVRQSHRRYSCSSSARTSKSSLSRAAARIMTAIADGSRARCDQPSRSTNSRACPSAFSATFQDSASGRSCAPTVFTHSGFSDLKPADP